MTHYKRMLRGKPLKDIVFERINPKNIFKPNIGLECELETYLEKHHIDFEWKLIGRQYKTDVGTIDLLVKDNRGYLVIELKRGSTSDKTVGQIARYMGWVKENIAEGEHVNGLIIAKKTSEKLRMACKALDKIDLKEYKLSIQLRDIESEGEGIISTGEVEDG